MDHDDGGKEPATTAATATGDGDADHDGDDRNR